MTDSYLDGHYDEWIWFRHPKTGSRTRVYVGDHGLLKLYEKWGWIKEPRDE